MFSSLEMRWFFDGSPDERCSEWLSRVGAADCEERRDRYLALADERVGVKVRQGRLELKWRLRSRVCSIGRLSGRIERWEKWSAPAESSLEEGRGAWIDVAKRRWQWRAPAGAVELVQLTLGGREHWSVAIESFGTGTEARRWFVHTLFELARAAPDAERFTLERSYGYPSWLAGSSC